MIAHALDLIIDSTFLVSGLLVVTASGYLLLLALASFFYREPPELLSSPSSRVSVLVPAHNEADFIQRCLTSLTAQTYPGNLFEIVVIADNCTDDTAAIAARSGITVFSRTDPDRVGKGWALRWGMDLILDGPNPPDAVVVVDADSVAAPDLLSELIKHFDRGADAVQAEYLALDEDGATVPDLRAAAMILFHRVRFAGRAAFGLSCNLVGNGMLLSRRLLASHPWTAFTGAEDLEYSIDLRLAGVRPTFAGSAKVRGPMPTSAHASREQRRRWEGGRLHVVRTRLPRLLRAIGQRQSGLIDAALDLATPPLGILALAGLAGTSVALGLAIAGRSPIWVAFPWFASLATLTLFVLAGLRAAGAPSSVYLSLARAPVFLVSKAVGTVDLLHGGHAGGWVRTERPSDSGRIAIAQNRTWIGGVPIDWMDLNASAERIMAAAKDRSFLQVCTVNVDFLVNAQRDDKVRSILSEDTMNIPDGAPVVWLGRLRGVRHAQRVAGADLVPELMERAALEGIPVFFVGGEAGASVKAADRLVSKYPDLRVTVYEPPWTSLEAMNDEEILRRIDKAEPGILLVALGHPKQEKWIRQHHDRLPMVAIGVGCSLDIIAGRRRRAPQWMQRVGLEWAYRACHEPSRLMRRYTRDFVWLVTFLLPLELYRRAHPPSR